MHESFTSYSGPAALFPTASAMLMAKTIALKMISRQCGPHCCETTPGGKICTAMKTNLKLKFAYTRTPISPLQFKNFWCVCEKLW